MIYEGITHTCTFFCFLILYPPIQLLFPIAGKRENVLLILLGKFLWQGEKINGKVFSDFSALER